MKTKKWGFSLLCLAGAPVSLLLVASLVVTGGSVVGYESYHSPEVQDEGYCADCHDGFLGRGPLHDLHVANPDGITSTCDLCHTGSGRDNPLTMWSAGDSGDGLGCTGCHGRDYGDVVLADYRGFTIKDRKKQSGYGLRLHHKNSGVTECSLCHFNENEKVPHPENVINPGLGNTVHYYFRDDVSLGGGAVDPGSNEDSANDTNGLGLDNDGDGLYDMNDPDCVANPERLAISAVNPTTGKLTLSWPTPSSAWRLQQNPLLNSAGWVDATPPGKTQRVNGYWTIEITPDQAAQFFRLTE